MIILIIIIVELLKRIRLRKLIDKVSQKIVRNRLKELVVIRIVVSGGVEGIQLKDELKVMVKFEREVLLKECLGKELKFIILQGDILVMKVDFGKFGIR